MSAAPDQAGATYRVHVMPARRIRTLAMTPGEIAEHYPQAGFDLGDHNELLFVMVDETNREVWIVKGQGRDMTQFATRAYQTARATA